MADTRTHCWPQHHKLLDEFRAPWISLPFGRRGQLYCYNQPSWFFLLKVPRGLPFQQSYRPLNISPFWDTCILIRPTFSFLPFLWGEVIFKKSKCFQKIFPSTIQQASLSPVPAVRMREMVDFQVNVMVGHRSELTFRRKQSYIWLN